MDPEIRALLEVMIEGQRKTDRIVSKAMRQARDDYRYQAEVYSRAVRQSLRREVTAFKLIFLRAGKAIEVKPDPKQGELFLTESS